jgi:Predicted N-acetylglucosamine kinase
MKLALGFDGGGTKTHCVLIDAQGHILAESRSGPSNPMRVGFGGAMASVCDGARLALQTAGVSIDDLAAICAGNAGTGQPEASERMGRCFPRNSLGPSCASARTWNSLSKRPVMVP